MKSLRKNYYVLAILASFTFFISGCIGIAVNQLKKDIRLSATWEPAHHSPKVIIKDNNYFLNNDTLKLEASTVYLNDYPIIQLAGERESRQCYEPKDKSHIIMTKHDVKDSLAVGDNNRRIVRYTRTILKYPYKPFKSCSEKNFKNSLSIKLSERSYCLEIPNYSSSLIPQSFTFTSNIGRDDSARFEVKPNEISFNGRAIPQSAFFNGEIRHYFNYDYSFAGIKNELNMEDEVFSPKVDNGTITNILMIHGMRDKKIGHFNDLVVSIANFMDYTNKAEIDTVVLPTNVNGAQLNPVMGKGEIRIIVFKDEVRQRQLRFFEVYWASITREAKDMIRKKDKDPDRSILADNSKNAYLIDLFGDLALYLSPEYKDAILSTVDAAVERMAWEDPAAEHGTGDSLNYQGDIYTITGSMGSQILFDAMLRHFEHLENAQARIGEAYNEVVGMAERGASEASLITFPKEQSAQIIDKITENDSYIERKWVSGFIDHLTEKSSLVGGVNISLEKCNEIKLACEAEIEANKKGERGYLGFARHLKKIFMISNQMPLTKLIELPYTHPADPEQLNGFMYMPMIKLLNKLDHQIDIISFFDPNDPLGYKLLSSPSNRIRINNVQLSNTAQWKFNPQALRASYLSTLKDPKLLAAANEIIYLDTNQQEILLNLDKPNEGARVNKDLAGYVVKGSDYKPSQIRIISEIKEKKIKSVFKTDTFLIGKDPFVRRLPRRPIFHAIKNQATKIVLKRIGKKIKKLNLRPAQLPYEYPLKTLAFDGIASSVEQNEVTQIMAIHGMRFKDPDQFLDMATMLAKELEFSTIPVRDDIHYCREGVDYSGIIGGKGFVRVVEYSKGVENKRLIFYLVNWAQVTKDAKSWLADVDAKSFSGRRSFVHHALKDGIITDGISDITMALNGFNPLVREAIDKAFYLMLKDNPTSGFWGPNVIPNGVSRGEGKLDHVQENTFLVSGSLGSKLFYDHLEASLRDIKGPLDSTTNLDLLPFMSGNTCKILQRTKRIYMLTNQLTLISLKDFDKDIDAEIFDDHVYGEWPSKIRAIRKSPLEIIAFNDPNDLLSFKLPDRDNDTLGIQNVSTNIAQGYEMDTYHLYDLARRASRSLISRKEARRFKKQIKQNRGLKEDLLGVEFQPSDLAYLSAKDEVNERLFLKPLKAMLDSNLASQQLVVRFDVAHEGAQRDKRIVKMMAKGTSDIKKTDGRNVKK